MAISAAMSSMVTLLNPKVKNISVAFCIIFSFIIPAKIGRGNFRNKISFQGFVLNFCYSGFVVFYIKNGVLFLSLLYFSRNFCADGNFKEIQHHAPAKA